MQNWPEEWRIFVDVLLALLLAARWWVSVSTLTTDQHWPLAGHKKRLGSPGPYSLRPLCISLNNNLTILLPCSESSCPGSRACIAVTGATGRRGRRETLLVSRKLSSEAALGRLRPCHHDAYWYTGPGQHQPSLPFSKLLQLQHHYGQKSSDLKVKLSGSFIIPILYPPSDAKICFLYK